MIRPKIGLQLTVTQRRQSENKQHYFISGWPESLSLGGFEFVLQRILPAEVRIDLQCRVECELAPAATQFVGGVALRNTASFR